MGLQHGFSKEVYRNIQELHLKSKIVKTELNQNYARTFLELL